MAKLINKDTKEELTITTLDHLKKASSGAIVELPSFPDGTRFVAKLKRPSILTLAQNGKIPNTLLKKANTMFKSGTRGFDESNEREMTEMFDILEIFCEASFAEPTYKQLKENDIELSDEQKLAIFKFIQEGVKSLENFRN